MVNIYNIIYIIYLNNILQSCTAISHAYPLNYLEETSQTKNNNLEHFNNVNNTVHDTSEFGQKSHFIDTDTQIAGKILILSFVNKFSC